MRSDFLDDLNRWSVLLVSPFIHPEKLLPAEHIAFVTESISAQTENLQKGPDSSKEVYAVHLEESALKELAQEKEVKEKSPDMDAVTPAGKAASGRGEEEKSKVEEEKEQEETGAGEHHHLHLSSCHECLQLENSTIESVKFASAENIPELPHDCSSRKEEKEGECLEKGIKRINLTGKPPNILIYLGSEAAKARFEQVKSVLGECIDAESYTIYQLQQQQVLRDPWAENSLLLVIATEEPIPEDSHKQFMTFLSKGGKILGFSSSFTFGGVQIKHKNKLRKAVHELVVTKKDSTEVKLNLLLSGCVFEEGMKGDASRVKVLSRLNNADKDTVIVHLTHGSSGGEAILTQAHLELDSNSMDVQTEEDFNLLKMSNSRRCEVLKEILTCLGLSCELSEIPALTPIYLLSPDESFQQIFQSYLVPFAVEFEAVPEGRGKNEVQLKACWSLKCHEELTARALRFQFWMTSGVTLSEGASQRNAHKTFNHHHIIIYDAEQKEIHLAFLKWLEGNVDAEGLRASSKVSLKFVSSWESQVEVTPSLVPYLQGGACVLIAGLYHKSRPECK
ncbi:hypothetical protein IHE44_0004921 [Lamprotornis superbus]|uniref:Biotin-protein ligase N-terminal domain-containing protein n=1 Tax=Lamprotornis superbus TaxID=245042 RepID=A0A835NNZ6_9PASS|nr:hypothetical protein IHE44_0004921 [Lamprotornis superbus]